MPVKSAATTSVMERSGARPRGATEAGDAVREGVAQPQEGSARAHGVSRGEPFASASRRHRRLTAVELPEKPGRVPAARGLTVKQPSIR